MSRSTNETQISNNFWSVEGTWMSEYVLKKYLVPFIMNMAGSIVIGEVFAFFDTLLY